MSIKSVCRLLSNRAVVSTLTCRIVTAPVSQHSQRRCLSDIVDPPDFTPPIPLYVDRGRAESIKNKKSRLIYQSRKRGMTENGLLLSTFAALYLEKLTDDELVMYDHLINKPSNDWELYYWMIGNKPTPEEYDNKVMDMLKKHAQNDDMDVRVRQPDLPEK